MPHDGKTVRKSYKLPDGFYNLLHFREILLYVPRLQGMIGAFRSIAEATDVNAQLVAGGIYEALITTVFGLIIAITALVAYNLLIQRVDSFSAEASKAIDDLIPELI